METKISLVSRLLRRRAPFRRGYGRLLLPLITALLLSSGLSRAALEPAGTPHDAAGPPQRDLPGFFGAIQINEPDHDQWAAAVVNAGLDSVQVTLYARQQAWDEPVLYWDRDAPWVVSEIRAARRAGLRVILVMRVALEHGLAENRHLWHGMIWPRDEHLAAWFDAYTEFVLWGAGLAATEGVALFALGNELSALTSTRAARTLPDLYEYYRTPERVAAVNRELVQCAAQSAGAADLQHLDGGRYDDLAGMLDAQAAVHAAWVDRVAPDIATYSSRQRRHERHWRDLVARVRKVYGGSVTYGANFDQFAQVGFWDALDVLGVTGYFPLSRYGEAAPERVRTMEHRWAEVGDSLAAASPLPVVFLELGWTRRAGGTVRPYSYDRVEVLETSTDALQCVHWASQPLDLRERVDAVAALARHVEGGGFPELRGLTLWKMTTRPDHRQIEPFAIVLGEPAASTAEAAADAQMLRQVVRVADAVRHRAGR